MKFLLFLLCIISHQISSQNIKFQCSMKMTELAEWRPVSAQIELINDVITVQETIGIEMKIRIDKQQDVGPSRFYSLKYNGSDNVRMAHPVMPNINDMFIVSVLKDHFQCFRKEVK